MARYLNALHVAAEHFAGRRAVANLDRSADLLLNGLTEELAWPTLRAQLQLLAAAGVDLVAALVTGAAPRDVTSAHDQAPAMAARHSRSDRAFSLRREVDWKVDRDWQEGAHSYDHVLGVMFENRSFDSR